MRHSIQLSVLALIVLVARAVAGDRRRAAISLVGCPDVPAITEPILFDAPTADRVLERLQIFPPDNAWHEDISGRPVAPDSDAIIGSIGRDGALGTTST